MLAIPQEPQELNIIIEYILNKKSTEAFLRGADKVKTEEKRF